MQAGEPVVCLSADELPLELNESCKDPEDEFAGCVIEVDRRALSGEHLEADATAGANRTDPVTQVSAEPGKLLRQNEKSADRGDRKLGLEQ